MKIETQLLCTFCNKKDIDVVTEQIRKTYTLAFNSIYALDNVDDNAQVILTYNIDTSKPVVGTAPESTISVHRKKQTNTIYTINAINKLIEEKNNGVLDKTFKIDWTELQNTVLVIAYHRLKKINTKISNIITIKN